MKERSSAAIRKKSRGQVLSEYVITLVTIVFVAILLMSLVYFITRHGDRMIQSVSIEYP